MNYRLLACSLLITTILNGQMGPVFPGAIAAMKTKLDSAGYYLDYDLLSDKFRACGQFNQQAAATLISDQGLVLVPRAMVLNHLPDQVDANN